MKSLQQGIQRRLNKTPSKNDIFQIHTRFFQEKPFYVDALVRRRIFSRSKVNKMLNSDVRIVGVEITGVGG